jgi:hypothetical protein
MTSLVEVAATGSSRGSGRTLTAWIEEQLIIPSYASSWAFASIGLHRAMSLPLQLTGAVRRRSVRTGDDTIQLVSVGREKLVDAIASGILGDLPAPAFAGRRGAWELLQNPDSDADLVIAEVHRWMAPLLRRQGWLIVPRSVRWQGDLAMVPPRTPSKSLQANLAKLKKHSFRLVQGTTAQDWDEFYATMVEPQARARHGSTAWVASTSFRRKVAARGTLHFIIENGMRVAGICTIACGETLWFPLLGVRQGDAGLLQRGASVAAFALPIEWARQNGYRRIDFGRTGSLVNDGVQQHKRKWGLIPVLDPLSLVTAVRIGSAAAQRAFAREPVLVETESGLEVYAGEPQ